MALSIAVHPLAPTLDMYGGSDPNAAYSLSGHVSISLSSSCSLFDHQRTARLLLQSVFLTFEGQSEVFTPSTGYSSLRLCSITKELAPSETELSNEDSNENCIWNVIFNLPIPGWLPPTTTLRVEDVGIRYSLYATVKFINLGDDQQSSWSFASLCAPFRSRVKSVYGQADIQLRRFISAPRADTPDPKIISYLVDSHVSSPASMSSKPRGIPVEVLNKIEILASVPEYADIEGNMLPLVLRMRTKDLCEELCKRLQVTEVDIDILQKERCRIRPSFGYLQQYPLPPREMQPPNLPLLDPHPLSAICDMGFFASGFSESVSRTFSLLPSRCSGLHKLSENNYVFANDATPQVVPTWYTMNALVPFVQRSPAKVDAESLEWAGPSNIHASLSSPLYSVSHDISIRLTCAFDLPSGQIVYEPLKFTVPITFASVAHPVRTWTPPPAHSPNPADAATADVSRSTTFSSSLPQPPATMSSCPIPVLPAYSQLYDFNGELKIDYSTPLPLYSPQSSTGTLVDVSSSTSTSPSADPHLHDDDDHNVKINTALLHGSDTVQVPV